MALGINESLAAGNRGGTRHLVYADGVQVKYPNKDKEIFAAILPAKVEGGAASEYLPYRVEDNEEHFNKWAVGLFYYPFINKEMSMISPESFDSAAFDPVGELAKLARRDPRYARIAGYEVDGKTRIKNAFKDPDCRIPSRTQVFAMNTLIQFDRETDPSKPVIFQAPGTAFSGKGAGNRDGKTNQSWGLLSELNRRNRNVAEDADISEKYYWGDITNPLGMQICVCKLSPPPGGGVPIYNMTPVDNEDPLKTTKSVLEARYNLDDILYKIEEGEIIEYLVKAFSDVPDLLRRAFSHRIANFDKMLAKGTSVTSTASRSHVEDGDDDIPMSGFTPSRRRNISTEEAPVAAQTPEEVEDRTASRSFAPDADDSDIPGPVSKTSPRAATKPIPVEADPEGGEGDPEPVAVSVPERKTRSREGATKRSEGIRSLLE